MKRMRVLKSETRQSEEDISLFKQLSFKYLPYWPLFAVLFVLFTTAGYFYLKNSTPIYESTASILIKDEKKGFDDSKVEESLNLFGSKNIVENEIEVIRSKAVLGQVTKDLKLYAPTYEERKFKTVSAYLSSPISVEAQNPDAIEAQVKKIYFDYSPADSAVNAGGNQYKLGQWVTTPWGVLKFTKNQLYSVSTEPAKYYFSLYDINAIVKDLTDGLKVTPTSKQSSILTLKLRDPVPKHSEAILLDLIKVYTNVSINEKTALASKTLDFVDDRLKIVAHELDSIESGIQKYRNDKQVVDISTQSKLYLESVQQSDAQLSQLNMQSSVLAEVSTYVQSKNGGSGASSHKVYAWAISDPVLTGLLDKMNEKQVEYEKLRKTVGENNPILVSLRNEIDKLRPSIAENIKSQQQSIEASKQNVSKANGKSTSMLSTIPQKERELVEISREQSIKNSIYSFLLQKREEASFSSNSAVADSRIVDRPYSSPNPVSPNKPMMMLIFPLLGIATGLGFVSVKGAMNNKIMFRSEIEKVTTFPILGELSFDKSNDPLVMISSKSSFIMEQFRQLRVAVALGNLGNPAKTKKIIVTSSVEGEGKSFVAANLAISLALAGKKVVLVDFDLHQPKQNEVFNVDNEIGVAGYLLGTQDADQIIKKMPAISHNFSLIVSGGTPSEPRQNLILSGKMESC